MNIVINPGSGPVEGASEAEAAKNIKVFAVEVAAAHDVTVTKVARDYTCDGGGRFGFALHMAEGYTVDVEMPGIPLDEVRFVGRDGQNIWDFPRLYVDGSSWVWMYALDASGPDSHGVAGR